MTYRLDLTVMVNVAVAVFPLLSVAVQVTRVLPSLKPLPEPGLQVTGSVPSTSSRLVTVNLTRMDVALRGARTTFPLAPLSVGAITSKASPGTIMVPSQLSVPAAPVFVR
jgi:hypothetical protein